MSISSAQTALPDADASDPQKMGWMQGFPPAPDKIIKFANGSNYQFPRTRWSFSHGRELGPTSNVWHGAGPVSVLPVALRDLDKLRFADEKGSDVSWADMHSLTYTDSILVLHKGKIVYERYLGITKTYLPHIAMSVTKSFVGTLAATLAAEGKLDPSAPVTQYIPELKDTAYGDAAVRQVMDMTIGVQYSENYADPKAEVWDYARSGGLLPTAATYDGPKTFYDFLVKLKKEGKHDEAFAYKTVNAEVLAWIVKRATGQNLSDLLSECIWQKLGTENDAYFSVDSVGTEQGGGGLNLTLRDMARFGEMMRLNGKFNGQQIIPAAAVEDIRKGADPAKFAKAGYATLPGYSYRNMWWVGHNSHQTFEARGIHGQRIYIDPVAEMVIVKFSSHPIAANGATDPVTYRAFQALANHLMK
ncbi:serine hydrolase [Undibacterium sp.]|uniref:serine hydrolase domain-containing protein n=1 Tax=Undibacterium sp. TaxID=1914977 RepID=UPI0027317146|nr:serine hydrolase [Undibacterium sp.]MDP1977946.1 serine hydrolase [Undibacterium sp.]